MAEYIERAKVTDALIDNTSIEGSELEQAVNAICAIPTADIMTAKSTSAGRRQPMKFMLDGCDISFVAEAPADITLGQLLAQCDKIKPHWCACGIRSLTESEMNIDTEIVIGYDSIRKTGEDVSCDIIESQYETEPPKEPKEET